MGLFNKLKNVLFEEEEIEIPVKEPEVKKEVKVEAKPLERKKTFEEDDNFEVPVKDQELFKAEKTFDFPVFDDEEFDEMKKFDFEEKKEEPKKTMGINLFDYEKPKIKREAPRTRTPEIKGRIYDTKRDDISNRKFKPSLVISPVYGVLDKNYKKEDIVIKKEEKKAIELDDVRKKAFGTLEESLLEEKESKVKFDSDEHMDKLLENAITDTIPVPDDIIEEEPVKEVKEEIRQTVPKRGKSLKEDVPETVSKEEPVEDDLFDLIDSMYEDQEEE